MHAHKTAQFLHRSWERRVLIAGIELYHLVASDAASVLHIKRDLKDFIQTRLFFVKFQVAVLKLGVA